MATPIHAGRVHAPFYVFLRDVPRKADRAILHDFKRPHFQPVDEQPVDRPSVILSNDSEWTLVADDWAYHLWHDPDTWAALEALARHYEVFWCAVGDVDHSLAFTHLRQGVTLRKYRFDEPGKVTSDVGTPLACECDRRLQELDELDYVLDLAESLGIVAHRKVDSVRVYARPIEAGHDQSVRVGLEEHSG